MRKYNDFTSCAIKRLVSGFASRIVEQLEHTDGYNSVEAQIEARLRSCGSVPTYTAIFLYTAEDVLTREATGDPVFYKCYEQAKGEFGDRALLNQLRKRGEYLRDALKDYARGRKQSRVHMDIKRGKTKQTKFGYIRKIEIYRV